MKTFKTAVIGCGMISKNHFKALKNVKNAECVVACDIRPERFAAAAETYGIPRTETDYHKVLDDPEIDVVHICLPHYLHARIAIEAMEHGKHVLCEKPMALDPADAEKMIEVRDRTGCVLGICFQNRYNDSSKYMRSLMDSGKMGKATGMDENKNTFVRLYGVGACSRLIEKETQKAIEALGAFEDSDFLKELSMKLAIREC